MVCTMLIRGDRRDVSKRTNVVRPFCYRSRVRAAHAHTDDISVLNDILGRI
jgi:hypothetical protein